MYLTLFKQIHPIYQANYDYVSFQFFAKVHFGAWCYDSPQCDSSIIMGYKSKIVDDVDILLNNANGVMDVAIDKNSCKGEVSRSL